MYIERKKHTLRIVICDCIHIERKKQTVFVVGRSIDLLFELTFKTYLLLLLKIACINWFPTY